MRIARSLVIAGGLSRFGIWCSCSLTAMLAGKLNPLPKPSIDTGMGLERVTAVLQGVISNYDTDLFTPLIERAAELTGASLKKELNKEAHTKSAASLRVIADHSRAATFLISDGVLPSNEGRGYVLRKIIRRAITHGRLLGQTKPFLYQMVFAVRDLMRDAYPELNGTAERVSKVVPVEETAVCTHSGGRARPPRRERSDSFAERHGLEIEQLARNADDMSARDLVEGTIRDTLRFRATKHSSSTTHSACPWTSLRTLSRLRN